MLTYTLLVLAISLILSTYRLDKALGIALLAAVIWYAIT